MNRTTSITNLIDKIKSTLRFLLPIVLGMALLWWLYRDINWADVHSILTTQLNYGVLFLSLVFGLAANVVRGLRWQLLIDPLVAGEPRPRVVNAICTVLGSYTVNMALPRAGELWRCAEYKRRESIPFSSLLGTLISDRLTDIICLGLILLVVIVAHTDFFVMLLLEGRDWSGMTLALVRSPWLYVLLLLGALGIYAASILILRRPNNRFSLALRSVWRGIQSIRSMEYRGLFIGYSLLIWLGYFGFFYITFFAFPFTQGLPVGVGLIAFGMSALSVLAPVQNGMAAWHWMVITALVTYGVAETDAKSFALIVHLTQTLWITLVGLVAIVALPIINKHYKRT